MSAAARVKRLDPTAAVTVFEQDGDISFANCGMPYYIGGVIQDRNQLLVQTPESMSARYGIDVRIRHRVTAIDRALKNVTVLDRDRNVEFTEPYDALILSPGAFPIKPHLPGIDRPNVFILKNLDDMDQIRQAAVKAKRAVVVGAGYIGVEVAENLRHAGVIVDIVERLDQMIAPLDPEMTRQLYDEARLNRVKVHLSTQVTSFDDDGVHLSDGGVIPADFTVMSVGVKPVSDLAARAGLKLTATGHIMVDEHMRTSDPAIFAVGDAVAAFSKKTGGYIANPLAGPANRQGRIAADNVCGRDSVYGGTQGTSIVKVFNLAAAGTGMNAKALKTAGVTEFHTAWIHPNQHPGYYPGAAPIDIKVIFDNDGRILGGQAVGREGVDVVINSLAQAMRSGQTVFDLEEVELAYCPVWGNAKHPINMVGFVASNILRGDMEVIEPWESPDLWLDVREIDETAAGMIPGALHIPMGQIESRLAEIPHDKNIGVYCAVGLRGYIVYRRLKHLGFKVRNLNGGYRTWRWFNVRDELAGEPMVTKTAVMDVGVALPGRTVANAALEMDPVVPDRTVKLDVCGLQCPGPLMKVRKVMDDMKDGDVLEVTASDPGFAADIPMWTRQTGNTLIDVTSDGGLYKAVLRKTGKTTTRGISTSVADSGVTVAATGPGNTAGTAKGKTVIVFSQDLDKVLASFIIANGAAAMGAPVTMFFTFWGLNVLRRPETVQVSKTFVERMFGSMMPRGARQLRLSNMNMGGMGTAMMKRIMKEKNVLTLDELIQSARESGIRLVACAMSMDLMGIRREELIDGVEIAGVGNYLGTADEGNVNLFI